MSKKFASEEQKEEEEENQKEFLDHRITEKKKQDFPKDHDDEHDEATTPKGPLQVSLLPLI